MTTETDETRQITAKQEHALAALLEGKPDREAAEAAGVTRQTVTGWRNTDAVFAAELNRRRADLWRGHQEQLRSLVGEAVGVLEAQLAEGGDVPERVRQAAAVHVLRAVGLYGANLQPGGLEDPEELEARWRREAEEAELRQKECARLRELMTF